LSTEIPVLRVGKALFRLSGSEGEVVLAYVIGRVFIELQQLEFAIISFLNILSGGSGEPGPPFDVFASKTFGNLLREMRNHNFLTPIASEMDVVKKKRDFFVHKFLFHRYGGPMMTTGDEYEALIHEASDLSGLFSGATRRLDDFMVHKSSLAMFVVKVDPQTGEWTITEAKIAKRKR
jgi:hypothetical protein